MHSPGCRWDTMWARLVFESGAPGKFFYSLSPVVAIRSQNGNHLDSPAGAGFIVSAFELQGFHFKNLHVLRWGSFGRKPCSF